jgi:hypothetical protein
MIEFLVCFIGIFVVIIAGSLAIGYWHQSPQGHQPKIDKPMGKPPTGGSAVRKPNPNKL